MKRRDMKRENWDLIISRSYTAEKITYKGKEGLVSLNVFSEVKTPFKVMFQKSELTLLDNNYSWLMIALTDSYIWTTALFDDKDNLIQVYFDITDGNNFSDKDNPYFDDLFLDVVLSNDGSIAVLDKDELDKAYNDREININQYYRTVKEKDKLVLYLKDNYREVINYCMSRERELKNNLNLV